MTTQIAVTLKENGLRLDIACKMLMPEHSRSMLTQAIRKGHIALNKKTALPKKTVHTGDVICVDNACVQNMLEQHNQNWTPQNISLPIIYDDQDIVVIDKPPNLVVHPGANHFTDTIANGLLHHYPKQSTLPRAGIVHRLDKDTSGLLVAAKTEKAYHSLVEQIRNRAVKRTYNAIVFGIPSPPCATINAPIRRAQHNRLKQTVHAQGKTAITHYQTLHSAKGLSYLCIQLQTGRTHQIRVHMQHIGNPIIGDLLYKKNHTSMDSLLFKEVQALSRQALHATVLAFEHPANQKPMQFSSDIPQDIQAIAQHLLPAKK